MPIAIHVEDGDGIAISAIIAVEERPLRGIVELPVAVAKKYTSGPVITYRGFA
jgi:hypothetical protein